MKDDAKPPWIASSQADRRWMRDWVLAKLDAMDAEDDAASGSDVKPLLSHFDDPNVRAWFKAHVDKQLRELRTPEWAIAEAHRGNIEPLRKLLPFVELKYKRKRGKHPRNFNRRTFLIESAREDMRRIGQIWKAEYGKINRPQGQITAVEIAAKRWGIPVKALQKGIPRKKPKI